MAREQASGRHRKAHHLGVRIFAARLPHPVLRAFPRSCASNKDALEVPGRDRREDKGDRAWGEREERSAAEQHLKVWERGRVIGDEDVLREREQDSSHGEVHAPGRHHNRHTTHGPTKSTRPQAREPRLRDQCAPCPQPCPLSHAGTASCTPVLAALYLETHAR